MVGRRGIKLVTSTIADKRTELARIELAISSNADKRTELMRIELAASSIAKHAMRHNRNRSTLIKKTRRLYKRGFQQLERTPVKDVRSFFANTLIAYAGD